MNTCNFHLEICEKHTLIDCKLCKSMSMYDKELCLTCIIQEKIEKPEVKTLEELTTLVRELTNRVDMLDSSLDKTNSNIRRLEY